MLQRSSSSAPLLQAILPGENDPFPAGREDADRPWSSSSAIFSRQSREGAGDDLAGRLGGSGLASSSSSRLSSLGHRKTSLRGPSLVSGISKTSSGANRTIERLEARITRLHDAALSGSGGCSVKVQVAGLPRPKPVVLSNEGEEEGLGRAALAQSLSSRQEKQQTQSQPTTKPRCRSVGSLRGELAPAEFLCLPEESKGTEEERRRFEAELRATEEMLSTGFKSIRLEKFKQLEQQSAREIEEERLRQERHRREERDRKLRDKAKALRNPKRRVVLEIERRRELLDDEKTAAKSIPMQVVQSVGLKGVESIEKVDVGLLRSRCLGIDCGAGSLNKLLDLAQSSERTVAWEASKTRKNYVQMNRLSAKKQRPRPPSILDTTACGPCPPNMMLSSIMDMSHEERYEHVKAMKNARLEEQQTRRLLMMRSI